MNIDIAFFAVSSILGLIVTAFIVTRDKSLPDRKDIIFSLVVIYVLYEIIALAFVGVLSLLNVK